ncbi:TRAP transporter small permease [Marivita sp. S6314]|uniref:TRAP transporter small permease n=1 Tax=Marivita sp. S6314 TaxID=2926406 RepID=UPI001FF3F5D7|nr:TRAP transporter small permease subunit [Marivita sp. S6314]MCK0151360.1 TRAP transporter small permease [Marivita sp. S6314]
MPTIKKIYPFLVQVPIWLACASLFVLMVMTFSDVILRSSFDAPIEAATELTRIFVAVMVFSVMPHISVNDGHIAVDLTDGIFERLRLSRLRNGVVLILSGGMLSWPVAQVWKLAERTRGYGDVTEYLGLPQFLTMYLIAAGITLAAIAMVIAGVLTLIAPSVLRELKT